MATFFFQCRWLQNTKMRITQWSLPMSKDTEIPGPTLWDLLVFQQSWKWKNGPLGDKPLIFQDPIFHFHDYGRQGINPYIVGHSQYLVPSILKDDIETDCLQTFVTLSVCWMPNSMYKLNPCNRFKGELMKIFIFGWIFRMKTRYIQWTYENSFQKDPFSEENIVNFWRCKLTLLAASCLEVQHWTQNPRRCVRLLFFTGMLPGHSGVLSWWKDEHGNFACLFGRWSFKRINVGDKMMTWHASCMLPFLTSAHPSLSNAVGPRNHGIINEYQ